VRVLQRVQVPGRARPLARYPPATLLSARQYRYQSTIAEIHDASPRTIPRQPGGMQTGMSPLGRGEGLTAGSLLGTPPPMGVAGGPNARYDMLLEQGRLREDSHQKGIDILLPPEGLCMS